jgi:hypothetical protein
MGQLSTFALAVIKLGYLGVLWLFILVAVSVMRRDLFGRTAVQSQDARPVAAPVGGPPARPRRGTPGSLVVTAGSMAGATLRLGDEPITIGRGADCTLVVTDDYASTRHARLYARNGQWFVEDLGSTNGTFVDRMRITGATPVPLGVPVRVGSTTVELRK